MDTVSIASSSQDATMNATTTTNTTTTTTSPTKPQKRLSAIYNRVPTVYIRDDAYSWLPARVIETNDDTNQLTVQINLPSNWHKSTVMAQESSIEDLEDILLQTPQHHHATTTTTTVSFTNHPAALRHIDLTHYPKGELPLQNVQRGTTTLDGKRDMADLPHLHEAAILYNLKERHANLQPYTRVGDIVVAMNPFTWIDGLYTQQSRDMYAQNIIWKDLLEEDDDDDDDDHDHDEHDTHKPRTQTQHDHPSSPPPTTEHDLFANIYEKLGCDPHVYETSSLAYKGLAVSGTNQTILVSGESGAGKTETVKILMESLATMEQTRPNYQQVDEEFMDYSSPRKKTMNTTTTTTDGTSGSGHTNAGQETVRRVLKSNPVFEAFGNAKTLRNDNSSRFGKFTQLQFDVESPKDAQKRNHVIPCCLLAGSRCMTYLLEKSRVVSHSQGERNYHIFYQLLAAPDKFKEELWPSFKGTTTDDFKYVGSTESNVIDGVPDVEAWPRTLEALEVFTLEGQSLQTLMRALCVVLQLGNLTFDHDTTVSHEEGGTVVTNPEELEKLAEIIGIPAADMEAAMTRRIIKTGYDEVNVILRPEVARDSCDALAKEIYNQVFEFLVHKINDYTAAEQNYRGPQPPLGMISLLDIFGFEKFGVNRFEQLCINYANEQLQYKYVLDNFLEVQEEYLNEGIDIFDFALVDNSAVLDLLEGKIGLMISLNEECVRPKGNDESYVYKVKMVHKEHERLIDEKLHAKTEFGIQHFAGPVTYDATKFVERNTDKLPEDLLKCAKKSTNELIRVAFERMFADQEKNQSSDVVRKKKTNRTVLEKFRAQLKGLMSKMEGTKTRYIRCVKPNTTMTPRLTDHDVTMHQLLCAGLVTAITISKESFPKQLGYEATKKRFEILVHPDDRQNTRGMKLEDCVNYILSYLLFSMAEDHRDGTYTWPFACGKTRVYFRAGALEFLETKRMDYYAKHVVAVQRWVRKMQQEARYQTLRISVIIVQCICRRHLACTRFHRQKKAAVRLQCWIRCIMSITKTQNMRTDRAATRIQTMWRAKSVPQVREWKASAVIIQRAMRKIIQRQALRRQLQVALEAARMDHKIDNLKQTVSERGHNTVVVPIPVSEAKVVGKPVDDKLLTEVEDMFGYLQKEIATLRAQNANLQVELKESEDEKREIAASVTNAESAASMAKISLAQLTKQNAMLSDEVTEHKNEATALRKELKESSAAFEARNVAAQSDYERKFQEHDAEMKQMVLSMRRERSENEQDKEALKAHITKLEAERDTQVHQLKDELRTTQDSHHEYLSKLMDVLETTHAARESETARIGEELQTVKEEKDAQILQLQREVQMLRQAPSPVSSSSKSGGGERPPSSSGTAESADVAALKSEIEHHTDARSLRGQKFQQVAAKLESAVTAEKSSGKMKYSPEELAKMRKMVRYLGDLYALEERAQNHTNEKTIRMLDSYNGISPPQNRAVAELQSKFKRLEFENAKLARDLEAKMECKRCERRDQRRREAQSSGQLHPSSSSKEKRRSKSRSSSGKAPKSATKDPSHRRGELGSKASSSRRRPPEKFSSDRAGLY